MDYIREIFATFGPIPTVACIGIVALLFYSIISGGKGGNGGTGGSRGTGGSTGTGSTPTPPPAQG